MAKQVVRNPMGYPDLCIPLPRGADDEMLAELCHEHTARLLAWIDETQAAEPRMATIRYDGSMESLFGAYQQHPESSFQEVRHNTRRTYESTARFIVADVGARLVRNVTGLDVKRWHREWKAPAEEGGPERLDRAHKAIGVLKAALAFGTELGLEECAKLHTALSKIHFPRGSARETEMTADQVVAFIRKALEMGDSRAISGKSMAIGVAAQFDLTARQKDIIGEYRPAEPNVTDALYFGNEMWLGKFRWDNIPGWQLRIKTSKTRSIVQFDLQAQSILFPLLDSVPHVERVGAIVSGRNGEPVRDRTYRNRFREIARAAGISDDVWLMDSRAGGATEADEAGADRQAISDHLTHSDPRTTTRYIRNVGGRIKDVADLRTKLRAKKQAADKDGA
jgi:hypothetical protein